MADEAHPVERPVGRRAAGVLRSAVGRVRAATRAEGAAESGLTKLIELNASGAAADALVAVALAGTLFFSVDPNAARGRVGMYLLVTMAPFALIAPVVGPVLDRFRHGRRYALAATMLGRGVIAWLMASALANHQGFALYPGAFAILVLSKAYGVSRSAVIPRLRPEGSTLVRANARVSLAGTLAGLSIGSLGAAIVSLTSPRWALRLAAIIFLIGTVLALRLPRNADSPEGEQTLRSVAARAHPRHRLTLQTVTAGMRSSLGPTVLAALRVNAALRFYTGFLTLFVAFQTQTHDFGPPHNLALGFFAIAAGGAGVIGTIIGARTRGRTSPSLLLVVLALVTSLSVIAGVFFSLSSILLVAVGAGIAQTIGKLALDSTIQEHVAEEVRTSAFARSETALQLSFVFGGACGLLPIAGAIGLICAGAAIGLVLLDSLRRRTLRTTA
ncbi:MAG: MFS transporter [Actinomycetes bacterium]